MAEALNKKGKHILISAVEHHAILHTAQWMRKQGFDVEELSVDEFGTVQPEVLKDALRPDTILVSIMMANNEIGTMNQLRNLLPLPTRMVRYFTQMPCRRQAISRWT